MKRRRMSRTERRDQLLRIMHSQYRKAKDRSDFNAETISDEAGVSEVLVYRLIGEEFKSLRSQLKKPSSTSKKGAARLRRENNGLRRQAVALEDKYKVNNDKDYAEAIRHIEAQDEEIRMLRGRVRLLEERLQEKMVVIEIPSSEIEQRRTEGAVEESNQNGEDEGIASDYSN